MSDENEVQDGQGDATSTSGAAAVAPVELEELSSSIAAPTSASGVNNLGRVMDVNVSVAARVGLVRKTISEVLDLLPGTVIDLERAAGEPIDLVIGDKLIAKGEIVVVDDHYGIRVTEVIQDIG